MIAFSRTAPVRCLALVILSVTALPGTAMSATAPREEVIRLWQGQAPGTETWSGDEIDRSQGGVEFKTNVTVPTLTVVRPVRGKANGTAVIVLPGGAFQALAWDVEGTEAARWLADQGITAFVLKYRVRNYQPKPGEKIPTDVKGFSALLQPGRKIAIADAEQAMRIVRGDAARYGVKPDRIGMIGFSAGGITTVGLILEGDPAARPNFAAPIYGMTMMDAPKVPVDAPPLFLAAAQDDILSAGSVEIYNLWSAAKRPAELHIYDQGGHGFGLRKKTLPVGDWPRAFKAWLASHGYLPAASAPGKR